MRNHHTTEMQIKRDHPEATCLEYTRQFQMVPETQEEVDAALRVNSASGFMRN